MIKRRSRAVTAIALVALLLGGFTVFLLKPPGTATADGAFPATRDPMHWPFAWNSIWNLPRGDQARLVPAGIPAATGMGLSVDEDVLVLEPDAPQTTVALNTAGWSWQSSRCGSAQTGNVLAQGVPIPQHFSTDPGFLGATPNMSAALLMADGATLLQTQPFHVCGAGGTATSQYMFGSDNLRTGEGIVGAHGGSGMSSIGGTVRLGELVPGGAINHAVKVELNCAALCYYGGGEADGKAGFRWPAQNADGYASGGYRGGNPAVQMGSLLALPNNFDESRLQTEPARILARAMRNYGGYVVDDTAWDVYAIATEWSPDGRVIDEFSQAWGFEMDTAERAGCAGGPQCDWANDMATIFTSLHAVDDNGPSSIGGAGTRLAPCAPVFTDGTGAAPADCGPAAPVAEVTTTAAPVETTAAPADTTPTTEVTPTTEAEATTTTEVEVPTTVLPPTTAAAPTTTAAPEPTTTIPTSTSVTTGTAPTTPTTASSGSATTTTVRSAPPVRPAPDWRSVFVRRFLIRLLEVLRQDGWWITR